MTHPKTLVRAADAAQALAVDAISLRGNLPDLIERARDVLAIAWRVWADLLDRMTVDEIVPRLSLLAVALRSRLLPGTATTPVRLRSRAIS
jgi:hypothetical protein